MIMERDHYEQKFVINVHDQHHEIIQECDEHHQVDEIKLGQVDLNQIQLLHCEHVSGHV